MTHPYATNPHTLAEQAQDEHDRRHNCGPFYQDHEAAGTDHWEDRAETAAPAPSPTGAQPAASHTSPPGFAGGTSSEDPVRLLEEAAGLVERARAATPFLLAAARSSIYRARRQVERAVSDVERSYR